MRIIYHLVPRAVWEQVPSGAYRDPSLEREGFIHCSTHAQVARVANQFLATVPELLLLQIDASSLGDLVVDEPAGVPFAGELFPHVFGPIPRSAIQAVLVMERTADGNWRLPNS